MIKEVLITALFFSVEFARSQSTSTAAGLNQNEVNVSRDGDYEPASGGVIRTLPDGKKGKVVTIVPDTGTASPGASLTAPSNNTMVNIRPEPAKRTKSKKANRKPAPK